MGGDVGGASHDAAMSNLASVISSVGTVVALAVSLVLLRQGQEDRRTQREDRRRAQASRVTCWCAWSDSAADLEHDHLLVPAIYVRNASDQAVYQAFVDYHHPERGLERIDLEPVPPGETRHRAVLAEIPEDPRWEPSALMPRLFFSDASGNAWMRTIRGLLREDPGPVYDGFAVDGGRLNLGLPRPDASTHNRGSER